MVHYTDWLPATQDEQLAMAINWGTILPAKETAWNMPAAEVTKLVDRCSAAEAVLAAVKNETTRMPVATAQCRTAFEALTAKMRDIKKRFFYEPPCGTT
jgi:hypothetical protein